MPVVRVFAGETADIISSSEGRGCLGIDTLEERFVGVCLAAMVAPG